jgi:hypothetical protein
MTGLCQHCWRVEINRKPVLLMMGEKRRLFLRIVSGPSMAVQDFPGENGVMHYCFQVFLL